MHIASNFAASQVFEYWIGEGISHGIWKVSRYRVGDEPIITRGVTKLIASHPSTMEPRLCPNKVKRGQLPKVIFMENETIRFIFD